jgi:SOS-response transcriptional repressor LexA
MIGLTPRQRRCLDAIAAHEAATGAMPSVDDLRAALGLRARSTVSRLLSRLAERGAITRVSGISRAIGIARCPHCGGALSSGASP